MSDHYHDPSDVKLLRDMRTLAPADFEAWLGLNSITKREDGAIPRKYRELIAIAVSCTTQCPYCLDAHTRERRPRVPPARKWPRRRCSRRRCVPERPRPTARSR
jgi:alkylhydroperoxidase family enzyme